MEVCKICGKAVLTAVVCPRLGGVVHDVHCSGCEFEVRALQMCRYGFEERWQAEQERAQAAREGGRQRRWLGEVRGFIEELAAELEEERRGKRKGL